MDIRKITDEELAKELEKFEHETDTSCFECGAEFSASVICWEDVAKFVRQCVKDSQPKGLSFTDIVSCVRNFFKVKEGRWVSYVGKHEVKIDMLELATAIHAAQERKGKDNNVA